MAQSSRYSLQRTMIIYFLLIGFASLMVGVEFLIETQDPQLRENLISNFERYARNEVEIDEVFTPIEKLRNKALLMIAIIMSVMIIVLMMFIKKITEPLQHMIDVSGEISKEVPIEVQKVSYPLRKESGEMAVAKDIANNGICFEVPSELATKTLLSLKIGLPGWQHHKKNVTAIVDDAAAAAPLTAIAEVVWSKKLSSGKGYSIGVKFLDIYEDDFNALKNYLRNITGDIE